MCIAVVLTGCPAPAPWRYPVPAAPRMVLSEGEVQGIGEDSLERMREAPHAYFRAINGHFSRAVCRRLWRLRGTFPTVVLHGDAHLEQLVHSGGQTGFSDFDDAALGPPAIDLLRFAVSLRLAAQARDWAEAGPLEAFWSGYRDGLLAPEVPSAPEALLRLGQPGDSTAGFLSALDGVWEEGELSADAAQGMARYRALISERSPGLGERLGALKAWGRLRGRSLGSARTARVLLRFEGESPDSVDDRILEAKELAHPVASACLEGRSGLPVVFFQSALRYGAVEDPFLSVVPRAPSEAIDDRPWWVQSWRADYRELRIEELRSADELEAVAVYAGRRLAFGHAFGASEAERAQLRRFGLSMLDEHGALFRRLSEELTVEVLRAHALFRRRR